MNRLMYVPTGTRWKNTYSMMSQSVSRCGKYVILVYVSVAANELVVGAFLSAGCIQFSMTGTPKLLWVLSHN